MKTIHCVKLDQVGEAIERAPWPGELGQRIVGSISKEAWKMWLGEQTILINENGYSPINPEHRAILEKEMVKYLFSEE